MTSTVGKRFGQAIRERRLKLKMSQEALAEKAGLHRTYVCDVELGRRNLSLESISKLANGLQCSLHDLFSVFSESSRSDA